MKSLLILVFSLSCSLGFANEPSLPSLNSPSSEPNRFDALATWFNLGSPLGFEDFKGFYHGRCFNNSNRNKPIATYIGYTETNSQNDDAGPGFSEPASVKVVLLFDSSAQRPANFFEAQTPEQNIQTLQTTLQTYSRNISVASETPTLSYFGDWEPNGNWDERFEIKRYNDYIIVKNTALIRQKYVTVGRVLNPGDTIQMCYYFTKFAE